MKRYPALVVKWLANKFGYKIGMIKIRNGEHRIEGDKEVLRYFDISGYIFKKEPFNRTGNNQ